MAAKKRKKKDQQNRKPAFPNQNYSKTYYDNCWNTARKMMCLIGLQASDFDALSKRTKQCISKLPYIPLRVRAETSNKVPREYLKLFSWTTNYVFANTFYGDPEFGIKRLDSFIYWQSIRYYITSCDEMTEQFPDDQLALMRKIREPLLRYEEEHKTDEFTAYADRLMKTMFLMTSQPNYRFYIYKLDIHINYARPAMECQAIVSSVEPEKRYFHINGERRPSFRLGYFDYFQKDGSCLPIMAEIPLQLLKNSNAAEIKDDRVRQGTDKLLPVYIQSHAIRRFTERMDATNNTFRNNVYSMSFKEPSVITTLNGQRMVKAIDEQRNCVGYFPYRQLENAILILSFLPLASPIVPEEAALFKELGVLMEDSRYIGMDKLSFYIKTDFGSVPRITEALKKVGMWHLTEIKPENAIERKEFDFLKKYFMENTRATSVQDQI